MARSSERVQELLAEKLAQQDADREVIGGIIDRYTQPPPKEDEDYDISGIPEAEEGVIAPLLSAFAPLKAKQTKAPESTYGEQFYRFTGGSDGDAFTTERPRTSYTPGEYDYKVGEPPIITGISDLLKFGDRALFGTPEEKAEVKKQTQEFIKGLPQILPDLMKGTIKSAQNIEAGGITTKDEDTGQVTRPTEFLYNMGSTLAGIGAGTARSIARTAGDDGQVLGIMGGARMKSGPDKIAELRKFEEQAVAEGRKRGEDFRPFYAELWGDQVDRGETLRVYRSVIDDQPRIEIDTSNVKIKDYDNAFQLESMLKGDNELDLKASLDQLLDFPELFKEYPHLRNIPISYDEAMDSNTVAAFQRFANDPESGEVLLGNKIQQALNRIKELEKNKREVADDEALAPILDQSIKKTIDEQILSPILHEVQHAVQAYERLEGGGNLEKFLDPKDVSLLGKYNEYESLIADIDKTIGDYTKNQFRNSDIQRRGGLSLSEIANRELGNAVHKFKRINKKVEADANAHAKDDGAILFMDVLREEWPNLTVEDKALLNASISRSSTTGAAKLNDLLSKTVEVDSTPMRDALNNYEFRDLQFGLDDWAKVYDDLSGFLIDIDDAVLKDRANAGKKLNKIINIQDMGYELYNRIPGEVEARLVQSLFEGVPSDVKGSVTPEIPQRKPVPRQNTEDFINSLFSEMDTPDFATGPGAKDAANLMITPRRRDILPETPEQFEADRRFMYPESALDVEPSEFIYHRGSDVPASRGKTKRALYGPPKGLADGGPVGDRVNELLDSTFRK
tara:strand:- start:3916 stop:6294 length:2379 start_codon:yes stop_codon:yes gene_type:complete